MSEALGDGGHDYVPDDILTSDNLEIEELLSRTYMEQLVGLRTQAIELLKKHDAISQGYGWAIFETNAEPEGTLMAGDGNVEILVLSLVLPSNQRMDDLPIPIIRIITNEQIMSFVDGENRYQHLTYDFTLDDQNDALYFVAAHSQELEAQQDDQDPSLRTRAPLFVVEAGRLLTSKAFVTTFCPIETLAGENGECETAPFGLPSCMEDKLYALEVGARLLDMIANNQPTSTGKL